MRTLVEHEGAGDLTRLSEAWADEATFAFLPRRSPVDEAWVDAAMATVPAELRRGHFALLTSGSTGRPKLVIGARRRSERLTEVLDELQGNQDVEQTILALPLSYSFAFVNQWLWATHHGRELVPTQGLSDPPALRRALREARNAMICLVGVQAALVADAFAGEAFPGVARLHFAGGRFPQELLPRLGELFPEASITNNYGCAEAMPRLTLRPADAAPDAANIGRPLPGIEMRADDDHKLFFRSPYGAVAVFEQGALKPIGPEDWVPSGDHGEMEADGSWRLHGRADEVFKRHGEKVSIAQALDTVGSVYQGEMGVYRDTDRAGEAGYVLVLAPGPGDGDVRGILRRLREQHVRAQWPLRIEALASLPRLPNGKLDTAALAGASERRVLWDQRT